MDPRTGSHGGIRNRTEEESSEDETQSLISISDQSTKRYKSSLWVMYLQAFLSTFYTTVIIPSLWHYAQVLHASPTFYGTVISSFCFASLLFSSLLGRWADKRPIIEPLLFSGITSLIGWSCYSFAVDKWMLLVGRFFAGIGFGSAVLAQAYIGQATSKTERSRVLARQMQASSLGYACGPGIGIALYFLPDCKIGRVAFNRTTTPGYLSILLTLIFLVLCIVVVKQPNKKSSEMRQSVAGKEEKKNKSFACGKFLIVVFVCIFGGMVAAITIMAYESVVVPQTELAFHWGILPNCILLFSFGIMMFVSIKIIEFLCKWFSEKLLFIVGQVVMIATMSVFIQWRHETYSLWMFLVGTLVYNVSHTFTWYPIYPIYSKSLGEDQQGLWMGFLQQGVMVGRFISPLWTGYALDISGPNLVWFGMGAVSICYLIVCLIFYRTIDSLQKDNSPQ